MTVLVFPKKLQVAVGHGGCHVFVKMQAVAITPLPALALGTLALLCPGAVSHVLIFVVPHIHKIVSVDVALNKVFATHGKTGRD